MNFAKISLAVLAGFLLGAMMFHTCAVKAQGNAVYVQRVNLSPEIGPGLYGPRMPGMGNAIQGSEVVGFSCVSGGSGDADCYVASR